MNREVPTRGRTEGSGVSHARDQHDPWRTPEIARQRSGIALRWALSTRAPQAFADRFENLDLKIHIVVQYVDVTGATADPQLRCFQHNCCVG